VGKSYCVTDVFFGIERYLRRNRDILEGIL